jgi:hypothetical protein
MKVFVSYSFRDSELYIITLLLEKLRQNGFIIESSISSASGVYHTDYRILNSNFFVVIITNNSESINAVIDEWRVAQSKGIKTVLVVEEGVQTNNTPNITFIKFNRNNPKIAIDQLLKMPEIAQQSKASAIEDIIAVGAIAVGLAALVSLLAERK